MYCSHVNLQTLGTGAPGPCAKTLLVWMISIVFIANNKALRIRATKQIQEDGPTVKADPK